MSASARTKLRVNGARAAALVALLSRTDISTLNEDAAEKQSLIDRLDPLPLFVVIS